MPIGGKDAFLSKVTFRRESKWYSKTKQELKDMETIEERAKYAGIVCQYKSDYRYDPRSVESGYMQGAIEQKAIDDAELSKLKSAWEKEENIIVPRWFLEVVEDTLQIQNNINQPDKKETGESCQDRNIRHSLNGLRKLLNGEELSGMERFEKLKYCDNEANYKQG